VRTDVRSIALRVIGLGAISTARARSLRLAAQDVALSRRKQGFESPRERQGHKKALGRRNSLIVQSLTPAAVVSLGGAKLGIAVMSIFDIGPMSEIE
jgi:hypothetical protein